MTIKESISRLREMQNRQRALSEELQHIRMTVKTKMCEACSTFSELPLTEELLSNRTKYELLDACLDSCFSGCFSSNDYPAITDSFFESTKLLQESGIQISLNGDSIHWEFTSCPDTDMHNSCKLLYEAYNDLLYDLQNYWILEDSVADICCRISDLLDTDTSIQVLFSPAQPISERLLNYLDAMGIKVEVLDDETAAESSATHVATIPLSLGNG